MKDIEKYIIVILITLITLIPIIGRAQATWTLDDVITLAEQQSIFRYQADADNQIAQESYRFYRSNFKPGVTIDLLAPNYSKTSREITQPDGSIAFQSVTQNNSSINIGLQQQIIATGGTLFASTQLQRFDDFSGNKSQYNGVPLRIGISQPLWGFNALKWDKKIQPLSLVEANRSYIVNMEDIHLRAAESYFGLLEARLNEFIAQSNTHVNNQLLNIAQERYTLGKASRSDLLQLELEYKSSNRNLSAAQYGVKLAEGALFTFLGQPIDSVLLNTPEPMGKDIIVDPALAIQHARANRPEIIAFERKKQEANRDINKAKTDYGIKANLFASYGLARGAQQIGDIYADPQSEQQLQLRLSMPILDWGRKKSAVAIARANRELVQQQIAQDEITFENEIIQTVANWHQLQQEVRLQLEIREVSVERFDIARERFVLGDISITDLTIAQREKDEAQRSYIRSLRQYWTTYYQLRKLTAYDFVKNEKITYYLNQTNQ